MKKLEKSSKNTVNVQSESIELPKSLIEHGLPEMGRVPRLQMRLSEDVEALFRSLAWENGITEPAKLMNWMLQRLNTTHLYLPLSDEVKSKLDAAAKSQGLDLQTFVLNLLLRHLWPNGAQRIDQALATGLQTNDSTLPKTNWARESREKKTISSSAPPVSSPEKSA